MAVANPIDLGFEITDMLVDEVFVEKGVFATEELDVLSRRYYFPELANMGITIDEIFERKLV